ncbi:MAG: sigma-70 family RNA polymerase sigma factor [Planctomycetota bacterium]
MSPSNRSNQPDTEQVCDSVVRAVAGDPVALEELLREHARAVCDALHIAAHWRHSFDGDDLVQVTSMEAVLRIGSLRAQTVAGFRAWLARMAENNLRDAIKGLEAQKRTPRSGVIKRESEGRSARMLLAQLASCDLSASAVARGREELELLQSALEDLPPTYKTVVVRVDLDERPVDEVAVELGRSPGAVHMLRMRAHERLRELLAE